MTENIKIVKTEKNWAGGVAFFASLSGIILGSIAGGIYGKYRALLIVEECAKQIPNNTACGSDLEVFIHFMTVGLIVGAIIGLITASVLYIKLSKRVKLSGPALKKFDQLPRTGKNGSTVKETSKQSI